MGAMSETPKPDGATVERFRAVMLPHLDAAYGFARWLTRDPVAAQDVAQEAMRIASEICIFTNANFTVEEL